METMDEIVTIRQLKKGQQCTINNIVYTYVESDWPFDDNDPDRSIMRDEKGVEWSMLSDTKVELYDPEIELETAEQQRLEEMSEVCAEYYISVCK